MSALKPLALPRVLLLGAGDLATGVAHRLFLCGFPVAMTELEAPRAVRRAASFAQAVFDGETTVEGVRAVRALDVREAGALLAGRDAAPVLVASHGEAVAALRPAALVDARLLKRNDGLRRGLAPLVVALGPGFVAGEDVDAVVETNRGPNLGRVYWSGAAEPDTGVPAELGGAAGDRVFRAPEAGPFRARTRIGARVAAGELLGEVSGARVLASIAGMVRGLLHDGIDVSKGEKLGDIDPRPSCPPPGVISDKSRAIGGGVVEAILAGLLARGPAPEGGA